MIRTRTPLIRGSQKFPVGRQSLWATMPGVPLAAVAGRHTQAAGCLQLCCIATRSTCRLEETCVCTFCRAIIRVITELSESSPSCGTATDYNHDLLQPLRPAWENYSHDSDSRSRIRHCDGP